MNINTNYSMQQNVSMKGNLKTLAGTLFYKTSMPEKKFDSLLKKIPTVDGKIDLARLDDADKQAYKDILTYIHHLIRYNIGEIPESLIKLNEGFIANLKTLVKDRLTKS